MWTIVRLTADDYEVVRDLWMRAGLPVKPGGRDSRSQFEAQIAGGTQTAIGAQLEGQLVGVVVATHDGRKGWINRLAVHPDYRRKGLALRLIEEAEQTLRAQGMQVIAALIEEWNEPSLALFERAGYVTHPDIHYLSKRKGHDV